MAVGDDAATVVPRCGGKPQTMGRCRSLPAAPLTEELQRSLIVALLPAPATVIALRQIDSSMVTIAHRQILHKGLDYCM